MSSTGTGLLYRFNDLNFLLQQRIDRVFASISDDLQNGYLLAFQVPSEVNPPLWHELQIRVKNTPKPVTVRARTGYSSE